MNTLAAYKLNRWIWKYGAVWNLHDFKSLCKRGLSRKRCKIVTTADHSNINRMSSIALAVNFISLVTRQRPVSASTDINADKLAEFFVEKVEGVPCCQQQCAARADIECSPWCISATSVKFPLRKCGKLWRVRLSKFRSRQKQWMASIEDRRQLELRTPVKNFWLRH